MVNGNIGLLVEKDFGTTFSSELESLLGNLEQPSRQIFSCYIATDKGTYQNILDAISRRVDAETIFELCIPSDEMSYRNILPPMKESLIKASGDCYVINVKGLESVKKGLMHEEHTDFLKRSYGASRLAHDFDQDLVECALFTSQWGLPKKTLLLIHIDYPCGKDSERLYTSAAGSDFKTRLWRF
ncbi:MAG: hypothetical protein V1906_02500 [Candidatus Woesearchaeota archaeon]